MASYKLKYTAEEIDGILESVEEKTIYDDATQSKHGLMSATDKTKLDALPSGTQIEESLQSKVDKVDGKGLSENDYTDEEKAFVASAYHKPSSGIPKNDLAQGVQTSLGKADTALQSFTETDPTVPSWAKQLSKPSYTASEVGAVPVTRKVNGKALSSDITLGASDVGALPSNTSIPSKVSDLANDSGFSSVSINRKVSTGTNIADITIDGTTTQLYAPQGGSGGEENVIEAITMNGASVPVTNKTAAITETDPTVPSWAKQSTKPSYNYSEIGNTPDLSGFVTKSVNDLTNYYLKSETYTKTEVGDLISAIQQFHYEIYASLPQTGESNVLYLIGPTGSGSDKYEEYVYANNAFTKIGDTSIDLSGYVTTTALNNALASYTPTSSLASVATSGDYDDLTNKPTIPAAQIQSDWSQSDNTANDFIKNKPTIPTVPTNVSAFTNDAGYLTSHQDISGKADKATTLSGYGITDAKIESGVITLGSNTITPLTSHQSLSNYVQKSQTAGLLKNDGTVDQTQYGTYSKPSNGIPASDLESGVIPTVPVQDVTVGGSSVLNNNVAVIPAIPDTSGLAPKIPITNHGTSDTTFTLTPNVFHVWGQVSSLTLTLDTASATYLDEFMFQFESGSTATTLSLPSNVKIIGTVEASKTYQCSIANNIAVLGGAS